LSSSPTCSMDAWRGHGKHISQASSVPPEAREHMGESADPFRLAIGVFHEPQRLESAITDLFADNFNPRDICLVGTRQAFDRLMPMSAGTAVPRALLTGQFQPLSPLAENQDVVATSGDLLRTLLSHAKWHGGARTPRSSPLHELLARSSDHIGHGAFALLVSAPDPLLQHRSSRILLRHSAHTVETHEFTPR
jgi:hypothetical protein